jgi:hypothetical protein
VTKSEQPPSTLIMTDVQDADGTMRRSVTLTDDGGLVIRGHDLGPGIERIFGCREYEFERRLSPEDVGTLRDLLALRSNGDVLATIRERFVSTHELEAYVEEHDIAGMFWNRFGD